MTFTMKMRGAPSGVTVAEYLCPNCDERFEATVERGADGNPPLSQPCPWCDAFSNHVISAPGIRDKTRRLWAAQRGRNDETPPPWVPDYRPVADGKMTMDEWNAAERKGRLDRTRQRMRKKGLFRRKRTIVGAGTGKASLPT